MKMIYLPDVNFWLALAFESHIHHLCARDWFGRLIDAHACAFCRVTQQGFLRLASNPKAFGEEAVTLSGAWRLYDALAADPRVSFHWRAERYRVDVAKVYYKVDLFAKGLE
jgi:uncharacterized protein